MKHLAIGQRLKTPNFSAFHWSPRGSLVSIGQHFVATRVVHLPKSRGGRVVRWYWVKLPVPGRPTIWMTVGQGPIVLAVGAGGGCLDIFTLICPFSPLSPSLWETVRYRLKYCLKGPLNPKQPTNQLPKSTETRLITESDQSGLNHQLLQLCGPCIAATAGFDGFCCYGSRLQKKVSLDHVIGIAAGHLGHRQPEKVGLNHVIVTGVAHLG